MAIRARAIFAAASCSDFNAERLLPLKLALDLVYVRRASLRYDVALIARTAWVLGTALLGRRAFPWPRELADARRIMAEDGAARMTA